MTVLGIHATGTQVAQSILASSFRPGRSLANYLGEGAYFYLVHGEGGYQNAVECADKVARRHYRSIACLAARISVDNALNLQNPMIRPLFAAFGKSFDRGLARLRVQVEPNDNASYYRPVSHLTIEAFRRSIEALSGHPFDVLTARFALKSRDIDVELPHEICVKRSRAILDVQLCRPAERSIFPSSDPASWPCADSTIQGAHQAVRLIASMDDQDLLDLIQSIYQGSDGYWNDPRPRFVGFRPIYFLHDSRLHERASEIALQFADAGQAQQRTIEFLDFAKAARVSAPYAQAMVSSLVEKAAGVVALLTSTDAEGASLLATIAERRPEVPILVLLAPFAKDHAEGEFTAPIVMRSRHNLCCLALPHDELLRELFKGFLRDRWTDALAVLDIESKMAARHGSAQARHRDARKIVETFHARKHVLL